jgi:hypothetical protein
MTPPALPPASPSLTLSHADGSEKLSLDWDTWSASATLIVTDHTLPMAAVIDLKHTELEVLHGFVGALLRARVP